MARQIPSHRFSELVHAGTGVFIEFGYQRAQMADVASALGVAKGTLYGYVESKEALFLLCTRYCDTVEAIEQPRRLPVPTPRRGDLRRVLAQRMANEGDPMALTAALQRKRPRDLRLELEAILREQFAVMYRNRHAIELIDRCGGDHPELLQDVQRNLREGTHHKLAQYLELRAGSRALRPIPDPFLSARVVLETLATWAVHIGWDRVPQSFIANAEDTVITFVLGGLLRDREHQQSRRSP